MPGKKLLLLGATGVIGQAVLNEFRNLPDWSVTVAGRRRPAECPEEDFIGVDLLDRPDCEAKLSSLPDITHVVYAAVYEKPGALIEGWRDPEQMRNNIEMLQNLLDPLLRGSRDLVHFTLFQGSKAYGSHIREVPIPAKERWPRHDHENFYWLQEDYLRERQKDRRWTFTILRPRIVFGGAINSNMNPIAALGAYAAILRHRGKPLSYPGGPARINQASDADIIAKACNWAAESSNSHNETFNVDNGDVFVWQNVWPAIAEALEMEVGPPTQFLLRDLERECALWSGIVEQHDLVAPKDLSAFVGQGLGYTDFQMATGKAAPPPPTIVSTIKIRQAGFNHCIDTEDMFRKWFGRLRKMRLLP